MAYITLLYIEREDTKNLEQQQKITFGDTKQEGKTLGKICGEEKICGERRHLERNNMC